MPKIAIKLTRVSKAFIQGKRNLRTSFAEIFRQLAKKQVIKDISLTINTKRTIGIYGPNGSGKSTLLRLIAGILQPDEGEIEVNGKSAAVIELGSGFNLELTGRENYQLYSTLLGMSQAKIDQNFSKVLDFSGLNSDIDLPVKQYSSGMRARLAFSAAAFSEADILLLDEVFAVGDREFLDKSRQLIEELKNRKTIVLSSHNLQLIQGFCSYIIKLKNGCLDQSGKFYELLFDLPMGGEIKAEAISNSMFPFIKKGQQVTVVRTPLSKIKVNDVVAVYFANIQELVIHRVFAKRDQKLILKGDYNFAPDQWLVGEYNLLGKVKP